MVAFRIDKFGGMTPAVDDRLLTNNAASYAADTWLRDGSLRGYRPSLTVRTLGVGGAQKVFRLPNDPTAPPSSTFSASTWMEFIDEYTDVLYTPVPADLYKRIYWTSPSTGPRYNTRANIQTGVASFALGIPAPLSPAGVVATGHAADALAESRAYLYTWVSAYGEEGPPSTPTLVNGYVGDTWNITVVAPGSQGSDRNLTLTRIYRTVTSSTGATTYFMVSEQPIGTLTYSDLALDTTVTSNAQLQSTGWIPPPVNLKGLVQLPNGIMAGWVDNDIYFCEPFRPHAWPAAYSITADYPIVGMGVFGQTLVVATSGNPSIVSGVHPSQMAMSTYASAEPCLSRRSIISTPEGVFYASQNGLISVDAGGIKNATAGIITTEQWINDVNPYVLRAARYRSAYVASRSDGGNGFVIDGGLMGFSWLTNGDSNLQNDVWTGEVLSIRSGTVQRFAPPTTTPERSYTWRSKVFTAPYPMNLGAAKVNFKSVPSGTGTFNVYADGVLKYTRSVITSGQIFHLASGFRATEWYVEITSTLEITSVEIASSARDLRAT